MKEKEKKCKIRKICRFEGKWLLVSVVKGIAISGLIAWLFFQSAAGLVLLPGCVAVFVIRDKKTAREREIRKEQQLFAEFLGFLREALQVGYSLEQAVGEAKKGMLTTEDENSGFIRTLNRMQRKMQLGMPVEEAFSEWAEEAGCEDVRDFAEVLFIAKRTGGAVWQVISNTERVIRDKQDTMRYIQSVLHSREYEAKIMKAMPFAMLLYLRLFMPDFLAPLYHNMAGVCIMVSVLLLYLILCYVADRATRISV